MIICPGRPVFVSFFSDVRKIVREVLEMCQCYVIASTMMPEHTHTHTVVSVVAVVVVVRLACLDVGLACKPPSVRAVLL